MEKEALKNHTRMSALFKSNRFQFEIERKKLIEDTICNAPPKHQEKLRESQANWDRVMKGAGSEHNRLVLAQHMFWEQVNNNFLPALQEFSTSRKT